MVLTVPLVKTTSDIFNGETFLQIYYSIAFTRKNLNMQLWKDASKELSKTTNDFNSSISFDSRMYKEDIGAVSPTNNARQMRNHNRGTVSRHCSGT